MGGSLLYLQETMQGRKPSKGNSKSKVGLRSLGQGGRIRAWSREGGAGSRTRSSETELRFVDEWICGGRS